ncbi:penicillin-binding protein activator LpoB [Pantoea agglomerans]|uniref:penicillin-binding protein activator LpoB n=1 Tax=Enterobacter agglomerans TaxID=549 RepID=UPI0010C22A0B|nr:penicillin-binding protein activator LpoB [Pantoea agglomerans]MBD8182951.1 penicillin-binding protein activator LpoB [Pantoea agglomerans]MBD8222021.1 penicillin-binding protein activator LpoB [Pantoea agglomerans]MCL6410052.1 penicillin-binding protein activator LpoB [Pantoea agglomerans]NEG65692.1 penicillin-binding protein activator LpoB [Pantoea agglomerans]NEG81643.1 penicillin-binding protein activator LpoB [Pantoea agglomerans]
MIRSVNRTGALLMALILTGCVVKQQQPAPVEPTQPVEPVQPVPQPEPVPQPQPVPQPPKLVTINWDASVQPLVAQMLQAASTEPGSVLLVDRVKNSTNGALQSEKATAAIQNALNNNGKFTLVSADQLAQAKQTLGLSPDDSLNSRSKAIGLARNVNAQYVLYSNARGDVKAPTLQMQLMLVQTGEIIWSGNGIAQN